MVVASALVLFVFAAVSACGLYWWLLARITPAPPPARQEPPSLGASSWARLRNHVEFLTARPRNCRSHDRLAHIVEYLSDEFRKAGGRVCLQPYQIPLAEDGETALRTYKNIIARFGAARTSPDAPPPPVVVIGAHYDSCGDTPGADDNASGVATLLEIARLLGSRGRELHRAGATVELVAYFGEEPPFFATPYMGSVKHANHLRSTPDLDVLGVIVLEMVGYFSDEPGSQSYPWGLSPGLRSKYGSVGDFIGVVGRKDQESFVTAVHSAMQAVSGLTVHSLAAPQYVLGCRVPEYVSGVDLSDHRSYWARGYEAVMITDTAFHRNPHYHQKTDVADTLDYPRMAIVGEQVAAAALALAGRTVSASEECADDLHAPVRPGRGARKPRLLDGRV